MKTSTALTIATLFLLTTGCDVPQVGTPVVVNTPAETEEPKQTEVEETVKPAEEEPIDMSEVPNEPPPITSTPREFHAKDAKRGKKSRKAGGYLGAVAGGKFYAENQMIKHTYTHAMNLYWGMEGRYPESHEEFMEKIIKFNKIQLPELEAGVEYIYDPEDHLLKVYRPEG